MSAPFLFLRNNMAVQHKDIPDSERHDVKGASSASLRQVLVSNGDGTTSFQNLTTIHLGIQNLTVGTVLTVGPSGTIVAKPIEEILPPELVVVEEGGE